MRMYKLLFFFVCTVFSWYIPVFSSEIPVMEEVVVTSSRIDRVLNEDFGDVKVITREEIREYNIKSLTELLHTFSSVTIRERGTPGSQADVSIRGSSYEGVLVLINGIRVRDPQTGHFTMDIPVELSSVERVEIMTGGGSSLYGASASGGVINIITGKGASGIDGGFSAGSFGTRRIYSGASYQVNNSRFAFDIGKRVSDGYRAGSDLDFTSALFTGESYSGSSSVSWNIGWLDKKFGAADFYAPRDSYEETSTIQAGINAGWTLDKTSMLRLRMGARGHSDDFILVRDNPSLYRNTHYNRGYTAALEYSGLLSVNSSLTFGGETELYGITSPLLGNRREYASAFYGVYEGKVSMVNSVLSARVERNEKDGFIFSPGAGLIFKSPVGKLRLKTESSYRAPTFTERYYSDPANQGNPDLDSERSLYGEIGWDIGRGPVLYGITVFTSNSQNTIDWTRGHGDSVWTASNHGKVATNGLEARTEFALPNNWRGRLDAVLLDQNVRNRAGMISKYSLNYSDMTLGFIAAGALLYNFRGTVSGRYERVLNGGEVDRRLPVGMKVSRAVRDVTMVLESRNILDETYFDFPGLPAPGRSFFVSMEYNGN